jgi:hypothetical protein
VDLDPAFELTVEVEAAERGGDGDEDEEEVEKDREREMTTRGSCIRLSVLDIFLNGVRSILGE